MDAVAGMLVLLVAGFAWRHASGVAYGCACASGANTLYGRDAAYVQPLSIKAGSLRAPIALRAQ